MLLRNFVRSLSSINVAVVGSGPAGFYTTQNLLHNPEVKVDIYDKLPIPFGLVRYGVAPDHPDVKNVINSFTKTAQSDRVNFYGNVGLGQDISLEELSSSYHAVVLAYGAAHDKLLNIKGESSTKNVISARNFVGWYNGVPDDKNLNVNLDCDTACIIGQGNVAVDCARVLLRPAGLDKTDITSYALDKLLKSKINRILIIGRRGPVQAAFTTKELRQLIEIRPLFMRVEPSAIFNRYHVSGDDLKKLKRNRSRVAALLKDVDSRQASGMDSQSLSSTGTECVFKFFAEPVEIVPKSSEHDQVDSLVLQETHYETKEAFLDPDAKPLPFDATETIKCGLVIRSIGYKANMVDPKLPYNHKLAAIANTNGRINGFNSLYCSGWLATGASGVIAGTLHSSQVTAESMLADFEVRQFSNSRSNKNGAKDILQMLKMRKVKVVHFNDWLKIDDLERRLGEMAGKTREKMVDIDKMLQVVEKARVENADITI